jgi:hypothetical protein
MALVSIIVLLVLEEEGEGSDFSSIPYKHTACCLFVLCGMEDRNLKGNNCKNETAAIINRNCSFTFAIFSLDERDTKMKP